jgi:hypothetical protein
VTPHIPNIGRRHDLAVTPGRLALHKDRTIAPVQRGRSVPDSASIVR